MDFSQILYSLCNPTLTNYKEAIKIINEGEVLEESEKKALEIYEKMANSLGHAPSVESYVIENKEITFYSTLVINEKDLLDNVRMFIVNRKNRKTSMEMIHLAKEISTRGLTEDIVDKINNLSKTDTVVTEYKDISQNIKDVYDRRVGMEGIKTGCTAIDKVVGGIMPGQLSVIAGYVASGKTTWGTNIAYNALVDGFNAIYISLEVSAEDILYNMISRHSYDAKFKCMVEHRDLKKRKLTEEQYNKVFNEILPDFKELPGKLYIVDEQDIDSYTPLAFETKMREVDKIAKTETGKGIDLVILDHVQLLKFQGANTIGREGSAINAFVSFFRQQAIDFLGEKRKVTVLLLSQTNRDGWRRAVRNEGKYSINALSEANELERGANLIMTVFSDESLKASKEAKVQLLKSRDGQTIIDPEVVYADFAYYVFGDMNDNTGASFADMDVSDIFGAQELDFDLSSIEADGENNLFDSF